MSAPRTPFKFFTGDQLRPEKLVQNFAQIAQDITRSQARRWSYSSFVIDFTGVASSDNASLRTLPIYAPKAYEIVGIECEVYQASGQTITIGCTATNFTSLAVATAGATTSATGYQTQTGVRVAADTNVYFSYSSTGGTNTACRVVVHIRSDRWSNTTKTEYNLTDVVKIPTNDVPDATVLNTEFTQVENAVVADTGAQDDLKIQVFTFRGLGTGSPPNNQHVRVLPASGRRFSRLISYAATAAGGTNDFDVRLADEAGSYVGTSSLGSTTGGTSLPDAGSTASISALDIQTTNPTASGSDYLLYFSRTGTGDNCQVWYAVLYQV